MGRTCLWDGRSRSVVKCPLACSVGSSAAAGLPTRASWISSGLLGSRPAASEHKTFRVPRHSGQGIHPGCHERGPCGSLTCGMAQWDNLSSTRPDSQCQGPHCGFPSARFQPFWNARGAAAYCEEWWKAVTPSLLSKR